MVQVLNIERLRAACEGDAAIRRHARLQPAGGPGDKCFPPTYEGGEYALEDRVIDGARVPCALLDSVQSQANRIEQALLDAHRAGLLKVPVVSVDFGRAGLQEVGVVTSLDAPHRLADAILRDCTLDGVSFRDSVVGKALDTASYADATELFGVCPTALVLGLWDSAGPRGGLGTKFARALVSEVIAIDAQPGVRPSSRIDPLQIQSAAGHVYQLGEHEWTLDEAKAEKEKGKPKRVGKEGKPSEINHGNVTPSLKSEGGTYHHGGVTFRFARQTTVLSLPALRRLRFPNGGQASRERDAAARVALAALALAGVVLSTSGGTDLRSRCLLVPDPEQPPMLELITAGGVVEAFTLDSEQALTLLAAAVKGAKQAGLPWQEVGVDLEPKPQLVELVKRSRALAMKSKAEG